LLAPLAGEEVFAATFAATASRAQKQQHRLFGGNDPPT